MMKLFQTSWRRLRSLWQRSQTKREIDEELQFHIEQRTATNIAAGMSPDDAARQARKYFGNFETVREQCRDVRGAGLGETTWQDVRFGLRMLRKSPGFTVVAVLTLALGIGANTAIFSVIDVAMFRALPGVQRPGELVLFNRVGPSGIGESFTYSEFSQFEQNAHAFANVLGFAYRKAKCSTGSREEAASVQLASGQYFSTLGVDARVGQTWTATATDRQHGGATDEHIAIISDPFWQRMFAHQPDVVGKSMTIGDTAFTIIGVMPPGFLGVALDSPVDVWLPMSAQPLLDGESNPRQNWVKVMARLKPEMSTASAKAEADLLFRQQLDADGADQQESKQHIGFTSGGRPDWTGNALPLLLMLATIVALVLLIACANLANLLLAKSAGRGREIGVRLALGASRGRIVRQLLTESIVLAMLGGAAGILVAKLGVTLFLAFASNGLGFVSLPDPLAFRLDPMILGFAALISLAAGVLFGLAPALKATQLDLVERLKESAGNLSSGSHRRHWNQALVAAQLAASLVLLIAAGLFVRSFQKLANVELGFDPQVIQIGVAPPGSYSIAACERLWNAIDDALRAYPGISFSASAPGLFAHANFYTIAAVDGVPTRLPSGERDHDVLFFASPGFFSTLGMSLLQGRDFASQDESYSPLVTVINEKLARRFFSGRNPVGQLINAAGEQFEIVGVVKDAKYDSVFAAPPCILYVPLKQSFLPGLPKLRFFQVRTQSDSAGLAVRLQQTLQRLDPNASISAAPLSQLVGKSIVLQHFVADLTGLFGSLGLLLASIGVYGIMSYTVAQRGREMGIRMALGARSADITRQVLWEAMRPVLGGLAVGLIVATALSHLVASQLFGLTTNDPVAIGGAAMLMIAVAVVSAWLPARRAARVDPMVALRYE